MNSEEIKNNVQLILDNFSKDEFVFDFLLAYDITKTSITRLKKGDYNLSKVSGELLYKNRLFFKEENSKKLLSSIEDIPKENRVSRYKPRFAIFTDYKILLAKDLKLNRTLDIKLTDLAKHFDFFLPLAGSEVYRASNDNEADRNASYKMADLYDLLIVENSAIYDSKNSIHNLNVFLSRLLFCFFAEDTDIFKQESIFTETLVQHTNEDGSDTHQFLDELFSRLNTEDVSGYPNYLAKFDYVNGGLFAKEINAPVFIKKARKTLIELGDLDWQNINPDIFGSMIQAVVVPEYRSNLGMHYTSVANILKLIKPLFLDELYEELEKSTNKGQLNKLIQRISKIRFLDTACGSGNFLIIAYKEIRLLEIEIIKKIIEIDSLLLVESKISLNQFYGIEIDDFAHEIAILSLWLAEHQMNQVFAQELAGYTEEKSILPLKSSGQIHCGNATSLDWKAICPIDAENEVYLMGNPPYLGTRNQKQEQKNDLKFVFRENYKNLDYIAIWFYKGAKYIEGLNAKCAFVSTNSICQGLLVSLVWNRILSKKIEIDFAYQSFKWVNNAKGNAGVTVVIVGLRNTSNKPKYIFVKNTKSAVKNINPYLTDATNTVVEKSKKPISNLPEMKYGNMPLGCSDLILSANEKIHLLEQYPKSEKYIRKLMGASEFIKHIEKYCLWIDDNELIKAEKIPPISERIRATKEHRLNSKEVTTFKLAKRPHQFRDRNTAKESQLIIPTVSSENREYIPCGYLDNKTIVSNSAQVVYDAQPYIFAIVNSKMHMVWVRAVGGKLETRYRYSKDICYNTFPFPKINTQQKERLNLYVYDILDERAKYPSKTMAWLYNPDTMPEDLKQAHQNLDEAIEQCYRLQPFNSDTERLAYLFKLYEKMVNNEKK